MSDETSKAAKLVEIANLRARRCIDYLNKMIATTRESVMVYGLQLNIDFCRITNVLEEHKTEETLYLATQDIYRMWRNKNLRLSDVELVVKLKRHFEAMDKQGIFHRSLGRFDIGEKEDAFLDPACSEDWDKDIHDVEKIGLFLCQELSPLSFQKVLKKIMQKSSSSINRRYQFVWWLKKEEKEDAITEPFGRFQYLLKYFDSCKDSPEIILSDIWESLKQDNDWGQHVMIRAMTTFKIMHKYDFHDL